MRETAIEWHLPWQTVLVRGHSLPLRLTVKVHGLPPYQTKEYVYTLNPVPVTHEPLEMEFE